MMLPYQATPYAGFDTMTMPGLPRTKHRGPKMQSQTAHARRKRKKALENKARARQRRK